MKGETSEPEKPHESTRGVWRRTTVTELAHMLQGIAELLSRYREEAAQPYSKRTGKPLRRTRVDATVATRYFAFYANTIESFYRSTIPLLKDKFGSWCQPEA